MWKTICEWWRQKRCPHWITATKTELHHKEVIRYGVCLQCGKKTPPNHISDGYMLELLERAQAIPPNESISI